MSKPLSFVDLMQRASPEKEKAPTEAGANESEQTRHRDVSSVQQPTRKTIAMADSIDASGAGKAHGHDEYVCEPAAPEEFEICGMLGSLTAISSVAGYGASEREWKHFDLVLGLTEDLLPVASDPSAPTSPSSRIPAENRGKVPSEMRHGMVGGITGWTAKRSTDSEVAAWSKNSDLGICVQTRLVRAFDVDIADPAISADVRDRIEMCAGSLPCRSRPNSGKLLLAFRMQGDFRKDRIETEHGPIEFLATGQQFIAVGTHPSGVRYEWEGLGDAIPELTPEEFGVIWQALSDAYGTRDESGSHTPAARGRVDAGPEGDLDRQVTLNRVNDETIADLWSALDAFTAQDADDYDTWVPKLGLALKSLEQAGRADEAHEMWHHVSAKSPRYDYDQTEMKWEGLTPNHITYLTIFDMAKARGWVNPKSEEALKANATAGTRQDRTDAGNVTLMAAQVDGNLRFVPERRMWLGWDGERWTPDTYGTFAQAAALQVAEHYHHQAVEIRKQAERPGLDDKERKRIEQAAASVEKWATQCRNKKAIDNMLALAKGDARFALAVGELDCDPWLFGVDNGVVDLRTGTLREACRDDYVTRRAPVAYNPKAQAPRWKQFIEEITAKPVAGPVGGYQARPALAAYMQRALGYAMTGSTGEHKMFIAIGEGSNGKNVLLDLLQWLMGDYCQTVPPEALMATRHDADSERPSPTAATLAGARAAISSESKDGQRLDVALVKRHTGGGYMTARFLRENTFRFEITHKLWLMTNHKPALDHMDEAMRGRLHMIPFDMRWNRPGHPERNPSLPDGDKDLPTKLKQEAEGVLAWLIAGAVAYVQEGLEPPEEVVRMTKAFFMDQDPLGRWLDTCVPCDARSGTSAADLFNAFNGWQSAEDEEGGPVSQKAFSQALVARGIAKHTDKSGAKYGLRTLSAKGN